MNKRFELSPTFTVASERAELNRKPVTPALHRVSPERAALIASILGGTRPKSSMPSVASTPQRRSWTLGHPTCH